MLEISIWVWKWQKIFSIRKMRACPKRDIFFCLQPKDAQRRVLQFGQNLILKIILRSTIKKTNIWSPNSGLERKRLFFNACSRCRRSIFFSGYYQKFYKVKLSMLLRQRFEKWVYEVRRKWKINVSNFNLGKKVANLFFFQKMRACASWDNFINYHQNMRRKDFFKLVRVKLGKKKSVKWKKEQKN